MSEKQLYWIGKGTFGVGKNAVKYNKPMPKIDPKRLKALIKEGSVGELKTTVAVDSDEVISDLKEQLKEAKSDGEGDQVGALQETLKTTKAELEGAIESMQKENDSLKSDLDTANKFLADLGKAIADPKVTIELVRTEVEKYNKIIEDKKGTEVKNK